MENVIETKNLQNESYKDVVLVMRDEHQSAEEKDRASKISHIIAMQKYLLNLPDSGKTGEEYVIWTQS